MDTQPQKKPNKRLAAAVCIVNLIGIVCLIRCAVPFLLHDTTVANPDAMIPMQGWEGGGSLLLFGTPLMIAANAALYGFVIRPHHGGKCGWLCFLPAVVCAGLAVSYLIVSFRM